MDNIFFNCILTKKIIVESKYLNENIDEYINKSLKTKTEAICINEGYIKNDSIKIFKKSAGILLGSRFTGDITYNVAYTADICNPVIGNIIDCKVKFINKLGILGNNGPVVIIISKQFHIDDEYFNKIKENDIIKVEVIAKKFSINDIEIKVVGKIWNENINTINKKDLTSSDLTSIGEEETDFLINDQFNTPYDNIDENENYSMNDEDEEEIEDDFDNSDDEIEELKVENPEELILDADDIEIDENDDYEEEGGEDEEDEEDEEKDEEDEESDIEYE